MLKYLQWLKVQIFQIHKQLDSGWTTILGKYIRNDFVFFYTILCKTRKYNLNELQNFQIVLCFSTHISYEIQYCYCTHESYRMYRPTWTQLINIRWTITYDFYPIRQWFYVFKFFESVLCILSNCVPWYWIYIISIIFYSIFS